MIELVVVIAILGLLVAIAVPRLLSARSGAELRANQATARTIMSAVSLAEANDGAATVDNVNKYLDQVTIAAYSSSSDTGWTVDGLGGTALTVYKDGVAISLTATP